MRLEFRDDPSIYETINKPWELRDRVKPSRTYSGKIKYERRKRFFTFQDIDRISKSIQPKTVEEKDFPIWANAIRKLFAFLIIFFDKTGTWIGDIFSAFFDLALVTFELQFEEGDPFWGNAPETIKAIGNFFNRIIESVPDEVIKKLKEENGWVDKK